MPIKSSPAEGNSDDFDPLFDLGISNDSDGSPVEEKVTRRAKPKVKDESIPIPPVTAFKSEAVTQVDTDFVVVSAADIHIAPTSNYGMKAQSWDLEMDMPSNWAEAFRSLDQLVDLANDVGATFLTFSGDTFDNGNPPAEAVAKLREALHRLDGPLAVFLNGNHDQQRVPGRHRTPVDVYLSDHPKVIHVTGGNEVVEYNGMTFALASWQRVAGMNKVDEANINLKETIESLMDQMPDNGPSMFLSHIVVDECTFDSGRRSSEVLMSARQFEASVPTALIESGPWQTAQLGHIHKRQQLGEKTWYTGSTYKVSFGERDEKKGANVIRFSLSGKTSVEFHPFKIRELYQLDLRGDARGQSVAGLELIKPGDLVRVMIGEDDEETSEFRMISRHLEKVGIAYDLRRDAIRTHRPVSRIQGMSVDADPVSAIRAYAGYQNTDPKLLNSALQEFDAIIAAAE